MKLLLDTAVISEIEKYINFSFIGGVTTNPSLLSKIDFSSYKSDLHKIKDLCQKNNKSLSLEVFSNDPNEIYKEAIMIHKEFNFDNLFVKIPIDIKTISVIQKLESEGIKINCTCVYTLEQSFLLALMNTSIISVFYNRTKDKGNDPNMIIYNLKNFIIKNNSSSKIITGSIRNIKDVSQSLLNGTDYVTLNTKIIDDCINNEGSKESINQFMKDLKAWQKE